MTALTTYVVHSYTPGSLPHPDGELGTVVARDREQALAIAKAQWPQHKDIVAQPLGAVITSEHAPKKKREYRTFAHWRRRA